MVSTAVYSKGCTKRCIVATGLKSYAKDKTAEFKEKITEKFIPGNWHLVINNHGSVYSHLNMVPTLMRIRLRLKMTIVQLEACSTNILESLRLDLNPLTR